MKAKKSDVLHQQTISKHSGYEQVGIKHLNSLWNLLLLFFAKDIVCDWVAE